MSLPIQKFVPTAVVAAVVVWCCWPHFGQRSQDLAAGKAAKLPRIGEALLEPTIKPPCSRDPFQDPGAGAALTEGSPMPAAAVSVGPQQAASAEGTLVLATPTAGEAGSASSPDGPEGGTSQPDAPRALPGLVLDATYVQGGRRFAIINGRVYQPGQELEASGPLGRPYLVREVRPDMVLLNGGRETFKLLYPGLPGGAAATGPRGPRHHD